MANFNLLPWREKQREVKKKQFFTAFGASMLLAAGMVFMAHLYMQNKVSYQNDRNQYLQTEISQLKKQIKEIEKLDETRQALMDRIKVIENLQSTRPAIVHLFDEMVAALPKGMYLTKLEQKSTVVGVHGKAESNARVSSYMNKLNASQWLSSSNLQIIAREKDKNGNKIEQNSRRLRDFRLTVKQSLKAREDKNSSNKVAGRQSSLQKRKARKAGRKVAKR